MINECLIGRTRIEYDGCSTKSLKDAISFYKHCDRGKGWLYVGSGYRTWHNGTENNWKELHHFFVKRHRLNEPDVRRLRMVRKLKIFKINESIRHKQT